MYNPPFLLEMGWVEPPTKFSKGGGRGRGGLTGSQFLEGDCWEREGGDFFRGEGGVQFLYKE